MAFELGDIRVSGSPREIGRQLGQAGRKAAHDLLLTTPYWANVTRPDHAATVTRLGQATRARFPTIWQELQGLAEGLALPFADVLAWNCRGDLLDNTADGCTTVQLPGASPMIGHNEDGLPQFRGHAFLAHVTPGDAPGFVAFCYPGSLPGHTFAATQAGLAQAVNNMRLTGVVPTIPRMVLGRALLACHSLDQAVALLSDSPDCGGFHMTLGQAGAAQLRSVEFGAGAVAVTGIEAPAIHANHALHLSVPQIVTTSSRDRQRIGEALLAEGTTDPIAILRHTGGPGLPILRTAPDDPDCENTLATVRLELHADHIALKVLDQSGAERALRVSRQNPA